VGEGFYNENTPSSIANTDLITTACQHSNLVCSMCKRGINNIEIQHPKWGVLKK
jgi:hypothetical protein